MTVALRKNVPAKTTTITLVDKSGFKAFAAGLPAATRRWLDTIGFVGAADRHVLLPDDAGHMAQVIAGVQDVADPFVLSALPGELPAGDYRLSSDGLQLDPSLAAMSWQLGTYAFDRYKPRRRAPAGLVIATSTAARRGLVMAQGIGLARYLINTPA